MPYKDRETYLRKQREFAARRKARKQIALATQSLNPAHNPTLTPTLLRTPAKPSQKPLPTVGRTLPHPNNAPVNPAPVPSTAMPDISQFQRQSSVARTAPTKGIALGQDQDARARRDGFQVDDCGNAVRVLKES